MVPCTVSADLHVVAIGGTIVVCMAILLTLVALNKVKPVLYMAAAEIYVYLVA